MLAADELASGRSRNAFERPEGTERLYADHVFNTETDFCEDYGHDIVTGAAYERRDHMALNPAGRAVLKACHYLPPHEQPDEDYPFVYTTGRTAYPLAHPHENRASPAARRGGAGRLDRDLGRRRATARDRRG